MRTTFIFLVLTSLVFVGSLRAADAAPATQPTRHVLIISVDGMRPDLMLRAPTPALHHLIETGSFTLWAQTTAVAVTMPSHVSMLTGVKPQTHQVEWNHDLPFAKPVYPIVPTLFELAKKAGYSTGMSCGKSKFEVLNKPGTIDKVFIPTEEHIDDNVVRDHALAMIKEGMPDVLFVHFPDTDVAGHASGWGSAEQIAAIAKADAAIGQVLAAVDASGLRGSTLVIVTADHGGAGKTHGADDPRSRHIPWIASGPGVKENFDLTTIAPLTIRTEDTFATACAWMNIPIREGIDGHSVDAIFDRKGEELLGVSSTTQPISVDTDTNVVRPVARVETSPVPHDGDSADDPAVWVHPTDPSKSLVIGTDKHGGLHAYDLAGQDLQTVSDGTHPDNVDVIYDVPLAGKLVDLAIAATRSPGHWGVKAWRIDPATRQLSDATIGGAEIPAFDGKIQPYGSTVYHSAKTGRCFYFVTNKEGRIEQYEITDAGNGTVGGKKVRELSCETVVEGCVADDELGYLYVSEEKTGIWKFAAEPDGAIEGKILARAGEHGLTADVEGLTLYTAGNGNGYLIASSQGNSTFKVYDRAGDNPFVTTIEPAEGNGIDPVSTTDGIVACNSPCGPAFPKGSFVVQDDKNPDANQNFKLYGWDDIAGKRLIVDVNHPARMAQPRAVASHGNQ